MTEPVWLSDREAVAINARVLARFGGLAGGSFDEDLLSAVLARPRNKWHYEDPKPDLFELAAAYAFGIARSHAFADGNKRTGYVAAVTFLATNGAICRPKRAEIVRRMIALAEGRLSEPEVAGWLRRNAE